MYIECELLLPSTFKKHLLLVERLSGTINFSNYTYDQVLQNDQEFYKRNTLLYPGYNKKPVF